MVEQRFPRIAFLLYQILAKDVYAIGQFINCDDVVISFK